MNPVSWSISDQSASKIWTAKEGDQIIERHTEVKIASPFRKPLTGMPVADVFQKVDDSEQAFYRWTKRIAGMRCILAWGQFSEQLSRNGSNMSLCAFFRYNSASGDRYRLEVTDRDVFFLVHETAEGKLVGDKIRISEESDERRIEAGLNMIDDLIANLPSLNESVDAALEGLKECRRKMATPLGS